MDITKNLSTSVEWFHGYGGNALGLKRAIPGLRSIAVCERDAFVVANMVSKMEKGLLDAVPIWTDCKTFPVEPFKDRVHIFIASYPCQGFSHAGKRLGTEDHRHLWPSCRRFIRGARPLWVWLENVEGHVSLGLSTVLSDLEEDGYTAAWGIFSASEVGAPHQRKRVFILAYDKSTERAISGGRNKGNAGVADDCCFEGRVWPSRPGQPQYGWEPPRVVSGWVVNPESEGLPGSGEPHTGTRAEHTENRGSVLNGVADTGAHGRQTGREDNVSQTQPPMGGNADGPAAGLDFARLSGLGDSELAEIREWMVKGTNRTDELRMCGNGVVPQTAERAFRVLYAELTRPTGADNAVPGGEQ